MYIDFERLPRRVRGLKPALQYTLVTFAKGHDAHSVQNLFESFLHFARLVCLSGTTRTSISMHDIQRYIKLLKHDAWRVGTLNGLLQKWFGLGLPGVDEECVQSLRERRKPGNPKGKLVRTRDPVQGPFAELEYTLLYKALDSAYGSKELSQWAFVLGRLLFASGQRISQYASMKVCDLPDNPLPDEADKSGRRTYAVKIPHGKTGHAHARMSFLTFDVTPQTGALLVDYKNELRALGFPDDSALFPLALLQVSQHHGEGQGIFEGHCTAAQLGHYFTIAISPFAPPTERLDFAQTPVAPRRFRYTFGTRMAEQGCSKAVMAERLGHVDLQQVDVYYEASPKILDNIDAAMGRYLAPIAQAFRGSVVENEESTTFGGVPGTRIIDFKTSTSTLASCGKRRACGFVKPVACCTCYKFEAWLDGPHEKLLKRLLSEREEHPNDPTIAAINDPAIVALREVIELCARVRSQRSEGG